MWWVSRFFYVNLFGIGSLRNCWNLFDFESKFEEIFVIEIDSLLSTMRGVAEIALGIPLFQTFKCSLQDLKIHSWFFSELFLIGLGSILKLQ